MRESFKELPRKKRLYNDSSDQVALLHYIFIVAGINCVFVTLRTVKAISLCEFFMSLRGAKAAGSKPVWRLGGRILATPGINSQSIREFKDGEVGELCKDRNADLEEGHRKKHVGCMFLALP